MTEKEVVVKNRAGIHARPAGMIVNMAGKFRSEIYLQRDSEKINAKSIMGLITLGVLCNMAVLVSADGDDEMEAVNAIVGLIDRRFEE